MTAFDILKQNITALEEDHAHLSEKLLYELSELSSFVYESIRADFKSEETAELFYRYRTEFLSLTEADEGAPSAYLSSLKARKDASYSLALASFPSFCLKRSERIIPRFSHGRRLQAAHESHTFPHHLRIRFILHYRAFGKMSLCCIRTVRAPLWMRCSREKRILPCFRICLGMASFFPVYPAS